jgi:hypothetical protein
MSYRVGDLVIVKHRTALSDDNAFSFGIVIDVKNTAETKIIDDMWNTKIFERKTLYKVIADGKIKTLDNHLIKGKA